MFVSKTLPLSLTQSVQRLIRRLDTRKIRVFFAATLMTAALSGCGDSSELSGTYEAEMGRGEGIRVEFMGGNKAKVSLFALDGKGEELTHNTVYTVDGAKLHFTTDEAFGAPMDLKYENGVLSGGPGMVFKKK